MKEGTRQLLISILQQFVLSQRPKIETLAATDLRTAYPFHRLVFPDQAILAARLERSIVTSMGSTLYPKLAQAIALDRFSKVYLEHEITGQLNDAASNMIAQIANELRSGKRRNPNHDAERNEILGSVGGGILNTSVTADLYIEDYTTGPLFIELKTPRPNLDMVAESKRKMLTFETIMARRDIPTARAFMGLTYNPFITREAYGHSVTKRVMDMTQEVLIGEEMWDYIGGPGTFEELQELIDTAQSSILDF